MIKIAISLVCSIGIFFSHGVFSDGSSNNDPNTKVIGFGCDKDENTHKCVTPYMIVQKNLPKPGGPIPAKKPKSANSHGIKKLVGMGCNLDGGECDQMYVIYFLYQNKHQAHAGMNNSSMSKP